MTPLTSRCLDGELAQGSNRDALTGLAPRSVFWQHLGRAVSVARREEGYLAVLLADVDNMEALNDALGHDGGDRVLGETAARLESSVRPLDLVSRFGGDSFAIVLPGTDRSAAERIADRITQRMAHPMFVAGREVGASVSIGIALWQSGTSDESLVRNVQAALQAAKIQHRGTHDVFRPESHQKLVDQRELAIELGNAQERDQFELHYQPIVATVGGAIVGAEALLRWRHPTRGLVSPAEFVPIAERSGAIVPIGLEVLERACCQASEWRCSPSGTRLDHIAVNLSIRQLRDEGFPKQVTRVLVETGLQPEHVVLEITETALAVDIEATITQLTKLKDLGVRLAIDDFGTGYSSLAYLHRLPVDIVKIDRSFVTGIAEASHGWPFAVAIVQLIKALSLETVAEGVETAVEFAHLRSLGCDYLQGYYFARPQPAEAFGRLLAPFVPGEPRSPRRSGSRC